MSGQISRDQLIYRAAQNTDRWLIAEADYHLFGRDRSFRPAAATMAARILDTELPSRWHFFQEHRQAESSTPDGVAQNGLQANLRLLKFTSSARILWVCGIAARDRCQMGSANQVSIEKMDPFFVDQALPGALPAAEELEQDYETVTREYIGQDNSLRTDARGLFEHAARLTISRLVWQYDQCGFIVIPQAEISMQDSQCQLWVRDQLEDLAATTA